MAARLTCTSDSVPDELSGLVELVRLLARQAAREAIASADCRSPSVDPQLRHHHRETLQ